MMINKRDELFLRRLHDEDGLSWIRIGALLDRINENTHRLERDFDLHPVTVNAIRRLLCAEQYVPKKSVRDYVIEQAFLRRTNLKLIKRTG